MFRRIVALVVCTAVALAGQAYPAGIEAPGAINAVTLYRGQALVTRRIPVKADPGYVQLVVTVYKRFELGQNRALVYWQRLHPGRF
ncbi:MAG: hypothetical protein R6V58_15605 [Planctomycetota bacterium]